MDLGLGAALGAGAGLLGDIGSLIGGQNSNSQNQQNIVQQEQFQETMSNSAYQRASADMTKAGLNPLMMYGSGGPASTPVGGAATSQNPVPSGAGASIAQSAKDAASLTSIDAQNKLTAAQKTTQDTQALLNTASAKAATAQAAKTASETAIMGPARAISAGAQSAWQGVVDSYKDFKNSQPYIPPVINTPPNPNWSPHGSIYPLRKP